MSVQAILPLGPARDVLARAMVSAGDYIRFSRIHPVYGGASSSWIEAQLVLPSECSRSALTWWATREGVIEKLDLAAVNASFEALPRQFHGRCSVNVHPHSLAPGHAVVRTLCEQASLLGARGVELVVEVADLPATDLRGTLSAIGLLRANGVLVALDGALNTPSLPMGVIDVIKLDDSLVSKIACTADATTIFRSFASHWVELSKLRGPTPLPVVANGFSGDTPLALLRELGVTHWQRAVSVSGVCGEVVV